MNLQLVETNININLAIYIFNTNKDNMKKKSVKIESLSKETQDIKKIFPTGNYRSESNKQKAQLMKNRQKRKKFINFPFSGVLTVLQILTLCINLVF